jgi:hypothetical protein
VPVLFLRVGKPLPGSDGTVQVEFHSDGFDVEAWVSRAGGEAAGQGEEKT